MNVIKDRSAETKLLIELGKKVEVGDVLTYTKISEEIHTDIKKNRGPWSSAMRILQRDFDIKFACVRNEGYRRVNGSGIVKEVVPGKMKSIRRKTNSALKDVHTALKEDLSNTDLISANTQASMLGIMREITKPRQQKRLEKRVSEVGKQIACGDILNKMLKPKKESKSDKKGNG